MARPGRMDARAKPVRWGKTLRPAFVFLGGEDGKTHYRDDGNPASGYAEPRFNSSSEELRLPLRVRQGHGGWPPIRHL